MGLCVPGMPCFQNTTSECDGCTNPYYVYPTECTSSECIPISSDCVTYTGANLSNSSIETGDDLTEVIQRLDELISSGGVPLSREITINDVTYDLSENREWNVGVVTSISSGTGISVGGTSTVPIITNTAPDQTVVLTEGSNISITGTYPNFTINSTGGGGITNGAAANELMMSNGTNAVASGVFKGTSLGDLNLGSVSLTGGRSVAVLSASTDASLFLIPQGAGDVEVQVTTGRTLINNSAQTKGIILDPINNQITVEYLDGVTSNFGINGGAGNVINVNGGDLSITGGNGYASGNTNGGSVYINPGNKFGSGLNGNIGLFTASGSFGSGEKVLFVANSTTVASSNPTGGIIKSISSTEPEGSNELIRTPDGHIGKTILQKKVTIAGGATLRAIGSAPQTIIAAPGSGKYLNIVSVTVSYKYGSAVYNFGDTLLRLYCDAGTDGFILPATGYFNVAANFNRNVYSNTSTYGTAISTNTSFKLSTYSGGSDATTGDGDLDVVVYYTVENENA